MRTNLDQVTQRAAMNALGKISSTGTRSYRQADISGKKESMAPIMTLLRNVVER